MDPFTITTIVLVSAYILVKLITAYIKNKSEELRKGIRNQKIQHYFFNKANEENINSLILNSCIFHKEISFVTQILAFRIEQKMKVFQMAKISSVIMDKKDKILDYIKKRENFVCMSEVQKSRTEIKVNEKLFMNSRELSKEAFEEAIADAEEEQLEVMEKNSKEAYSELTKNPLKFRNNKGEAKANKIDIEGKMKGIDKKYLSRFLSIVEKQELSSEDLQKEKVFEAKEFSSDNKLGEKALGDLQEVGNEFIDATYESKVDEMVKQYNTLNEEDKQTFLQKVKHEIFDSDGAVFKGAYEFLFGISQTEEEKEAKLYKSLGLNLINKIRPFFVVMDIIAIVVSLFPIGETGELIVEIANGKTILLDFLKSGLRFREALIKYKDNYEIPEVVLAERNFAQKGINVTKWIAKVMVAGIKCIAVALLGEAIKAVFGPIGHAINLAHSIVELSFEIYSYAQLKAVKKKLDQQVYTNEQTALENAKLVQDFLASYNCETASTFLRDVDNLGKDLADLNNGNVLDQGSSSSGEPSLFTEERNEIVVKTLMESCLKNVHICKHLTEENWKNILQIEKEGKSETNGEITFGTEIPSFDWYIKHGFVSDVFVFTKEDSDEQKSSLVNLGYEEFVGGFEDITIMLCKMCSNQIVSSVKVSKLQIGQNKNCQECPSKSICSCQLITGRLNNVYVFEIVWAEETPDNLFDLKFNGVQNLKKNSENEVVSESGDFVLRIESNTIKPAWNGANEIVPVKKNGEIVLRKSDLHENYFSQLKERTLEYCNFAEDNAVSVLIEHGLSDIISLDTEIATLKYPDTIFSFLYIMKYLNFFKRYCLQTVCCEDEGYTGHSRIVKNISELKFITNKRDYIKLKRLECQSEEEVYLVKFKNFFSGEGFEDKKFECRHDWCMMCLTASNKNFKVFQENPVVFISMALEDYYLIGTHYGFEHIIPALQHGVNHYKGYENIFSVYRTQGYFMMPPAYIYIEDDEFKKYKLEIENYYDLYVRPKYEMNFVPVFHSGFEKVNKELRRFENIISSWTNKKIQWNSMLNWKDQNCNGNKISGITNGDCIKGVYHINFLGMNPDTNIVYELLKAWTVFEIVSIGGLSLEDVLVKLTQIDLDETESRSSVFIPVSLPRNKKVVCGVNTFELHDMKPSEEAFSNIAYLQVFSTQDKDWIKKFEASDDNSSDFRVIEERMNKRKMQEYGFMRVRCGENLVNGVIPSILKIPNKKYSIRVWVRPESARLTVKRKDFVKLDNYENLLVNQKVFDDYFKEANKRLEEEKELEEDLEVENEITEEDKVAFKKNIQQSKNSLQLVTKTEINNDEFFDNFDEEVMDEGIKINLPNAFEVHQKTRKVYMEQFKNPSDVSYVSMDVKRRAQIEKEKLIAELNEMKNIGQQKRHFKHKTKKNKK